MSATKKEMRLHEGESKTYQRLSRNISDGKKILHIQ